MKTLQNPVVSYSENRSGDNENPFGYVYFTDNTRVGYSPGLTGDNYAELWPGNWGPTTSLHLRLAGKHLQEEGLLHGGEVKVKLPNDTFVTTELDSLR